MKGRALIDMLREARGPVSLLREEFALLADAVAIADEAATELIKEFSMDDYGWWDASQCRTEAAYLERRGLIERAEGEPHMVRFIEP